MKIAFDVMGSDAGPYPAIEAALKFVKEFKDTSIVLVGDESEIKAHLSALTNSKVPEAISIIGSNGVIGMNDGPMAIVRNKESSMVKTINLMKSQEVQGILTSGSTAAYLAGCHLLLGEVPGIKRPAFMPIMPTMIPGKQVVLLDVGANVENTPEELINFAIMAHIYCKEIKDISNPSIALLNIGLEENKGTDLQQTTYKMLKEMSTPPRKLSFLNFRGNIEPREVLSGEVDIIICNGYTGNICLKTLEGVSSIIFGLIKREYKKNLWRKFCAFLSLPVFRDIKTSFDYKNTGGAQLIGINGCCFKAHGSSDSQAYLSTLKLVRKSIMQDVTNKIISQISKLN